MEYTSRPSGLDLPKESTEAEFSLSCAHRISDIFKAVDSLMEYGVGEDGFSEDGRLFVVKPWQDRHQKGVSLLAIDIREGVPVEKMIGDSSQIVLQTFTSGRSKVDINNTYIDDSGNTYKSSLAFSVNPDPYYQTIECTVDGAVYDHNRRQLIPVKPINSQDSIRELMDKNLNEAEQTISRIKEHIEQTHDTNFDPIPETLEKPLQRTLRAKSILDTIEQLKADSKAGGWSSINLEDGIYSFEFNKTERGRIAEIRLQETDGIEYMPESDDDIIIDGDETIFRIQQSRGGTTRITIDVEKTDRYNNTRRGSDIYEFFQQRNHIEHSGSGFSFDLHSGAHAHNKSIVDQTKLNFEVSSILDSAEETLGSIVESL